MKEDYLHFIWKNKRIPVNEMKLTDGRLLTIINVGTYNENLGGPDFNFGSIKLDGVQLYGQIEMHVKSSDWYRHMHHKDRSYDNVILHVVYENDLDVIQNGVTIPTLELKNRIEDEHYLKYVENKIKCQNFPCEHLLHAIDPVYLESMKLKALSDKLNAKNQILESAGIHDGVSSFYHLVGMAFGMSVNKEQFKTLVDKFPYSAIAKVPAYQRYNLLVSESGIIQSANRLGHLNKKDWNFKGTRPGNFPTIRVSQIAFLASRFDFNTTFKYLAPKEILITFKKMIQEIWQNNDSNVPNLSKGFMDHLIINAVVPFLWYYGERVADETLKDRAIELLGMLPPEKNNVTSKWIKIGVAPKNAFDSQGLLALHRYYCCRKKCLSCGVGNKLLNRD